MVYKKRVQKLFDLKPVNNPFWVFYKGFVLNRYDRRRLNKIISFVKTNDTFNTFGILRVEKICYKRDLQLVEITVLCLEYGYISVAVKKDLWDNLLKFNINYLTVNNPLPLKHFYMVNVDKTVGEVVLNNF